MGCNTSQELKTNDAADAATVNGGAEGEGGASGENGETTTMPNGTVASIEELKGAGSPKTSSNHHTNHSKSNSIISNGDASNKHSKDADPLSASSARHNGVYDYDTVDQRNKAEIAEFNDMGELGEDEAHNDSDEEPEVEIRIPHHHHHHGSNKKIHRNPLKNLDLDFKFDVNSF